MNRRLLADVCAVLVIALFFLIVSAPVLVELGVLP